jgi:GT2 family glycosyltransferase
MRFAAFIMTFNRPQILRSTLSSVLSQSRPPEHILVVDNGESAATLEALSSFAPDQVAYHSMGENTGPAGATAYALQRLAREQFDWIYWVDDDDPPQTADILERLLAIAESGNDPRVGGVGAVGSRFDWRVGEMRRLDDAELNGILDVDVIAGNQQLILNRQMIEQVGVADSRLFFGLYEPEYCLRIRRGGYRLLVDGQMMREHRERWNHLDMRTSRSVVPGYTHRNMWQRYYRTRNYIFMMRKTFGRPDLARREAFKAAGRCGASWKRGVKYGRQYVPLQLRGVVDGYRGRMRRTIEPAPNYKYGEPS